MFLLSNSRRRLQILSLVSIFTFGSLLYITPPNTLQYHDGDSSGSGAGSIEENSGIGPGKILKSFGGLSVWDYFGHLGGHLGGGFGWNDPDGPFCESWNPDDREEDDHPACLKARQYRQIQRVIQREEEGKHPHWHFTREWNLEAFRNTSRCFLPKSSPDSLQCHERPLIVSGWWYSAEVVTGKVSGEVIWMTSIVKEVQAQGYQIAMMGPYENWIQAYEMMPDVINFLWNNDIDTISCIGDPRCLSPKHYVPADENAVQVDTIPEDERGVIPIWKLLVLDYWGSRPTSISNNNFYWSIPDGDWSYSPLGQAWTATPWPLPGHTYLPYSLEENCPPVKPWEERNDTALLFAKRSSYFDYYWVPKKQLWTNLTHEKDFKLLTTVQIEEGHPLPEGLETVGAMNRQDYEDLVGGVKVMVGMGFPLISPSVYQALCQGTPVVLPKYEDMKDLDGWGMYGGWSQHGPAAAIGPPFVYSYDAQNYTSLVSTIRQALSTPIGKFIPKEMTIGSVKSHLHSFLNTDWISAGQLVIEQNGGNPPSLLPKILDRCFELNRCHKLEQGKKTIRLGGSVAPVSA